MQDRLCEQQHGKVFQFMDQENQGASFGGYVGQD
jgi:hypothetical protein